MKDGSMFGSFRRRTAITEEEQVYIYTPDGALTYQIVDDRIVPVSEKLYFRIIYGNEAYAALVMKKAACSGFAKAYTLLCNAANVPVRHVNQSSWTHQWNEVKINGKWVKVDTYEGSFASTDGIRESILKKIQ
jgi:transglutaminase/protease-like cytokinesis protein 3